MQRIKFPIPFWKMNGAGNDFILIDHRQPLVPVELMPTFARLVCRRRFSVGADGLFFLEPSSKADFRWRFFNADGSEAEMCGNGARCVARFAYMNGIAAACMRFETLAGIIEATVADTEVTISMTAPHSWQFDLEVEVSGRTIIVHSVDTGVPHAVVFVEDIDATDVVGLGRQLRYHSAFAPAGTNVDFVGITGDGLRVRTYERGVEDETLACGTGVVASALIASAKGKAGTSVSLLTSGGSTLGVQFTRAKNGKVQEVLLKGPTALIYKGELTAEALQE